MVRSVALLHVHKSPSLWHSLTPLKPLRPTEGRKCESSCSISGSENSRTARALIHHTGHHSTNQVSHRVTPSTTAAHGCAATKSLFKKLIETLPLEHLSKKLIGVEVMWVKAHARLAALFLPCHVVVTSLLCVRQVGVGLANFLKGILSFWRPILVRVHSEGQLAVGFLDLVIGGRFLDS